HARNVHHRGDVEPVLELPAQLLLVALLQARLIAVAVGARLAGSGHYLSISSPQSARLQTRTCSCLSLTVFSFIPIRVGRLHVGQTTITLATGTGAAFSITPPGVICVPPIRLESRIGFGRVWRLTRFRFSTITRRSAGRESMTRPCLPRSLPLIMWTRSPFLTFILVLNAYLNSSRAKRCDKPASGKCAAFFTYKTSGASETIFMKFLSRNSRATGPKMRVPRGLFALSMITAAFSSNAIDVPSSRPYGLRVRTTTAWTTSPFLIAPCGVAVFTVAVITSPTRA